MMRERNLSLNNLASLTFEEHLKDDERRIEKDVETDG